MTIVLVTYREEREVERRRQANILLYIIKKISRIRRILLYITLSLSIYMTLRVIIHQYSKISGDPSEYQLGDGLVQENRKLAKDQPGYFMKGKYPVLNSTFCKFNYGLPNKLDWGQVPISGTPQLGTRSPYRVIYNAIDRSMFDSSYALEQVTYATHVTPEFLYHIVEIARFWDGPISVSAFVPNYDLDITMKLFTQLCRCYDGMSKVAVHLVYPITDKPILLNRSKPPKNNTRQENIADNQKRDKRFGLRKRVWRTNSTVEGGNLNEAIKSDIKNNSKAPDKVEEKHKPASNPHLYNYKHFINIDFRDCSTPDMTSTRSFRSRHGLVYPVNVARNVARNASSTQYNLVSDVELIPSEGLATKFTGMVQKHRINGHYGVIPKWRLAFVIPVFEVEQGEDVPRNKSSLQQLYAEGKAVYFHRWVCSHCQKIPDLQAWLKDDPGNIIKPFAITKRQFPYHRWEPIYIATKNTPWYSETLSWEGRQDKMTQPFAITKRQFPYHRWEPIYIATKNTPWYSETLSWEGRQDKMTQMLEMCLKSYDFVVVDGAFLCHAPGIKTKSKNKTWRYRHELMNTKQYDMIIKNLAERYPANPKCRLG